MSISGIGAIFNHTTEYKAGMMGKTTVGNSYANQSHNVQKSQMPDGAFVLHYFDNDEGEHALSAACGTDYSITVYEPKDYDPANPVYKVKLWDKDGNVTERMVDVTKVDPKNSDYIDMYAYSCYVSNTGSCSNALSAFMGSDTGSYGMEGRTYKDLFTVKNWVKAVEDMMQMQFEVGNLQGYLDYKNFFDFLMKGEVSGQTSEAENIQDKNEESDSRTEVVVKPDGSKVLLITTQAGGIQRTTSVELSKPDDLQKNNIQDGSIISDSVKNAVMNDVNEQNGGILEAELKQNNI